MKAIHIVELLDGRWGVFQHEVEAIEEEYGFLMDMYRNPVIAFDGVAEMHQTYTSGRLPIHTRVIQEFEITNGVYMWVHRDRSIVVNGQA